MHHSACHEVSASLQGQQPDHSANACSCHSANLPALLLLGSFQWRWCVQVTGKTQWDLPQTPQSIPLDDAGTFIFAESDADRVMPSRSAVLAAGRFDLHHGIMYQGGYNATAAALDRPHTWPRNKVMLYCFSCYILAARCTHPCETALGTLYRLFALILHDLTSAHHRKQAFCSPRCDVWLLLFSVVCFQLTITAQAVECTSLPKAD